MMVQIQVNARTTHSEVHSASKNGVANLQRQSVPGSGLAYIPWREHGVSDSTAIKAAPPAIEVR